MVSFLLSMLGEGGISLIFNEGDGRYLQPGNHLPNKRSSCRANKDKNIETQKKDAMVSQLSNNHLDQLLVINDVVTLLLK